MGIYHYTLTAVIINANLVSIKWIQWLTRAHTSHDSEDYMALCLCVAGKKIGIYSYYK